MPFDVLTKEEAARKARISMRQFHIMIQAGEGPALTRIGRRVLVRTDALADWLDRRTDKPAQKAA